MRSDGVDGAAPDTNKDRRFGAAWPLQRCPIGEIERAACTGERKLLSVRARPIRADQLIYFAGEELGKKRRSRFPDGAGTLIGGRPEVPGLTPKLWLIADIRRCLPLIRIVRNRRESFQTMWSIFSGFFAATPNGQDLSDRYHLTHIRMSDCGSPCTAMAAATAAGRIPQTGIHGP